MLTGYSATFRRQELLIRHYGGPRMSQKSYRPFGAIAAVMVFAFLAGCTSSGAAEPTSETVSSAESAASTASQSPTVTSETTVSIPTAVESTPDSLGSTAEVTPTETGEAQPTTNPWPDSFTPEQAAQAQAALTAYLGYYDFISRAYRTPGQDWSTEVAKWAADPVKAQFLQNAAATAELGQYWSGGSVVVYPTVSSVEGSVAAINACVDSSNVQFLDKDGKSIKAPDAPGSYFRHPATAEVALYASGAWLVTVTTSDYSQQC